MITGFNTDIEHEGVVYHVQTEDKGLDSPLILSLVYSGGAILASKRSRYEDLIAAGFDEEVLSERLKRQHRLICAAINAGRLEDLKRMGAPPERAKTAVETNEAAPSVTQPFEVNEVDRAAASEANVAEPDIDDTVEIPRGEAVSPIREPVGEKKFPTSADLSRVESAYTVYDPRRQSTPVAEVIAPEVGAALTMLDDHEFRAGEDYTIRVLLQDRSGTQEKPLIGIAVSVKILGTTFRPRISSIKTARDGVAVISATMPSFTSGRAAILIQAVVQGQTVEVRRVIHPADRPGKSFTPKTPVLE